MSALICGCGKKILAINDGKDQHIAGICTICVENDGDFTKSPYWGEETVCKDIPPRSKRK